MKKNLSKSTAMIAVALLFCVFVAGIIYHGVANAAAFPEIKSVYAIKMNNISEIQDGSRDYLLVVNEQNPYDFSAYYHVNIINSLVYMANDVDGDTMAAEKSAYLAYTMMKRDLAAEGIKIGIYDGYRSAADQQYLIDTLGSETNPVADVGYTEHHTGLLLTIVVWDEARNVWAETLESQQVRDDFARLHAIAADYGFILRYPEGKEDITGMSYRPADLRFVGSAENAHAIMDKGLTLEEFVESLK